MSVRIDRSDDRLCVEWALLPRLSRHLGWIAFALLWPVAGFMLASALRGFDGSAAMALAVGPALAAIIVGAPRLAGEWGRPPLVLVRSGTKIVVGRAPALERQAFSVRVLERRRLFATAYVVSFSCIRKVRQADIEYGLLNAGFRAPEPALGLASELRQFIGLD